HVGWAKAQSAPTQLRVRRWAHRMCVWPLLYLRRDLFQDSNKPLAIARTDDTVEVALMLTRTARHRCQHLLSCRSKAQAVGAPVAVHALTFDKAALDQILDHRREAGFVAAVGEG